MRMCCVFFTLWCVTLGQSLKAQSLYVSDGQQIYLGEQSVLTVNGAFESQGTTTNRGTIYARGDWTHAGTYNEEMGTINFAHSTSQDIHHYNQSIYHLALSGRGDKILQSDLAISSILSLESGILKNSESTRLIFNADIQINGGSDSSYIEGMVINQGTGDKLFPLGANGQYLPFSLLEVTGTNPVLGVQLQEPHPAPEALSGLEAVSSARYWMLTPLSGTYEGATPSISIGEEPDFSSFTGLVVAAANSLSDTYISLGNAEINGTFGNGRLVAQESSTLQLFSLGLSSAFSERGQVLVPNAFAPNSPLEDDRTLSIFAVNLEPDDFVFRIYNRWGKLIYETYSLSEALDSGWNGINQETNQPAQFGVYTYYLSGKFSNNEPLTQKGTLTLFR
ncbi:gliding motility-associated C-terminal domain-containing protein [Porifericola rhodea]|uniref:T9SS type B sorting domain-containing protein n=1 Tax=Porifericola rhodea TaxID=930972 RepID=UPI0026650D14|nr:gliding motility-associated C-terminal domain-containing protein [Porifericola rhodea]WKN32164.1 gliding motility-associated C-terminal domain-containing protein [Porifericola rhodea]